jgi:hypothetical protein
MSHSELVLSWSTLAFLILLVALVFTRDLQRRLPFFAAYAAVALACYIALESIYHFFGFRSVTSYYAFWVAEAIDVVMRSLVVAELCRYRLREYQGIWAITRGFLILLSVLFLGHAIIDAWGQPNRLVISSLTFERDINIASVIILILLLLIRTYYGLALEPLHRQIATGICFVCIVEIVNNTIARNLLTGDLFPWYSTDHMYLWAALKPQVDRVHDLWGSVRVFAYMVSMSIWCFALRKPLPAPARVPVLLSDEVYREISSTVNVRLRAFNDRLLEMLEQ